MPVILSTREAVPCYHSQLLDHAGGVAHGFSTRRGGVSSGIFDSMNLGHARGDDRSCVLENYRRFCAATGTDVQRLVFTKQVHGDAIRRVDASDAGKGLYRPRGWEVDGLVTNTPNLPLVIFSADCIPVLLYDPVQKAIGACHSGWRGTARNIAGKTADMLCQEFASQPKQILAAIGPGISSCCFETHQDVPDAMLAAFGDEIQPCITSLPGGKYRVDCKAIIRHCLLKAGLLPEHIEISNACTCCSPELFWSHRKVGQSRGSMAAVLQLTQ